MKAIRRMMNRLRGALSRNRREEDLAEELDAHIQMQTDENVRAGMTPDQARRSAVLKFGGLESIKASYRDQHGFPFLENFCSDIRYAVRGFWKNRMFTVTAVAALALGIGATTAIFSVVNAALLKPMHISDPDRLVVLINGTEDGGESIVLSPAQFVHLRKQTDVLEDVSPLLQNNMNYRGANSEQWQSVAVSTSFFRLFRMRLIEGRAFTADEERLDGPKVAVLNEDVWKQKFGSDPGILGKPVVLNDEPYTVIGIVEENKDLDADFGSSDSPQVYIPFQVDPNTHDNGLYFNAFARLKSGVSLQQARTRLKASADEYRAGNPEGLDPKQFFTATTIRETMVSSYRALFAILLTAVSLLLLIACANVANMMLARTSGRDREIAIRAAIGAGRGRVIQQLMTENLLLSVVSGVIGCGLGFRGIRALLRVNTFDIPLLGDNGSGVRMDWHVLLFALTVSLLTAIVFGVLPALQASRSDLNTILKNAGPRSGGGIRQNKARAALVISEVSLAVVLLVGSSLLIRSFVWLYRADRGFVTKNVLTIGTLFSSPKYKSAAVAGESIRAGLDHIRSLPGVVAAGATGCMPLRCGLTYDFDVIGRPAAQPLSQLAGWATVSPGFFETLSVPFKRGRTFSFRDDAKSPPVVIINEAMAKQYWKDRDPLQDQIVIAVNVGKPFNDPPRHVVGIVGDIRAYFSDTPQPMMYVPAAQVPIDGNLWLNTGITWVMRTQTTSAGFVPAVREELRRAIDLPIGEVHSMDELVALSIAEQKLSMLLMAVFGCSALLLAAIGIYGVMAYTVQQRTSEIGIRMALGAEAAQVRNMVVRQGAGVTLLGLALGLIAAFALARSLEGLLVGVKVHDPIVFTAVPLILGMTALLAVWMPATRASRVNPVDCLRCE